MSTTDAGVVAPAGSPRVDDARPHTARRRRRIKDFEAYLLLGPALVLVGIFAGYPLLRSVWYAFNEANLFEGIVKFVGFDNFGSVVTDRDFGTFAGNTAVWTFGAVAIQLVCGLGAALLMNQRFVLRGVFRGLAMIPWATPSVLVALMWLWILDPNHGILNKVLLGLNLIDQPLELLSSPGTALPTLIMIDVWQGVPLFAVMILAALQGVPPDLREAAAVDGCGRFATFRSVVLPVILPTIMITTLLRLIWTANYVDLVLIMTQGGPGTSSTTWALESYITAYKSADLGKGAAYAVLQAVILCIFVAMYLRMTRRSEKS
ncbi:sugar ABC transporter permease [Nakamurella sp. A5-74]|uniref:Sugar ABC transporter permease n=1 Tax=Nakamurella sp. A5-74 TaxID=3158264 RepID=A0AAU8DQR7_9ACTN